jgi:signal transduction histidine kinase/CheY-like chemotaxis protein
MRRWFDRLPIHRKLVAVALAVTGVALILATAGQIAVDVWRFRVAASNEHLSLAEVIAENTAAAVEFDDARAAEASLATVSSRPSIRRACLYLPDGRLFAGHARSPSLACPPSVPDIDDWEIVDGRADVRQEVRRLGMVYVEGDLTEVRTRVVVATLTGLVVLVIAGGVAFALAYRLHRAVSRPIASLAAAARTIGADAQPPTLPAMEAGEDEVGDLVRAFTEMLRRVREANARLVSSNERLRRQEADREQLLAREREASRLKDEFLAAVSHELRTPLTAILGWAQILTTTAATEEVTARAVASIARNARAQSRVIEDLVDVSRIVSGKLHLQLEPMDLKTAIDAAVDVIRPAALAKGLQLLVRLPAEVCLVHGDHDRLQQVIWNLLSNAVKFTPTHGTVTVSLSDHDGSYWLEVADSGVGIPADFLPHVFDRFRQADGSITREHRGLGLGLAIVKELTELHGGTVIASSPGPHRGARFTVQLPQLPQLTAPASEIGPATARSVTGELLGIRILAVDDNADARDVLAASLAGTGAAVRLAATGAEAIREWDREPADLLICDLAMPEMDGFAVLRAIRERGRPDGRATPAIAVSAHVSEDYQARTRAAGFDSHIAKPYDVAELVQLARSAVARVGRRPGKAP